MTPVHASTIPWHKEKGILLPDAAPDIELDVERAWLLGELVRQRALGAFWTTDWDSAEARPLETSWWYIICDDLAYDLNRIPSKNARRDVRYGLKRTEVKRIDQAWLADHGYVVYLKSAERYEGFTPHTPASFSAAVMSARVNQGEPPREFWGVFSREDGRLVAFGNYRLQGRCAGLSVAKFDPDASELFPMYALYFETARNYLRERGFDYVASGSRSVAHETKVEQFRLRLGWRTCHVRLQALLLPPTGSCGRLWRGIRELLGERPLIPKRLAKAADGFAELQRIARANEPSFWIRNVFM